MIGSTPLTVWPDEAIERGPPGTYFALLWSGAECDIWVYVDRDGRVVGREGIGGRPPAWYDRLRQRLGV